MANAMDELVDDLAAEGDYLDSRVAGVPEATWEADSPAEGWKMRDCIAHLAELDETAAIIAESGAYPAPSGARSTGRDGVLSGYQVGARTWPVARLLESYRTNRRRMATALRPIDPRARLPWAGNELGARSFTSARLMEAWSHGLDALDAAGLAHEDSDRLRHVAHLGVATRPFAYRLRGLPQNDEPLRVELSLPSGASWASGPEDAANKIEGTASDFCRVVTQRIHPADTALRAAGEVALQYLEIAQAFAGPPGAGRPATGG